VTNEHKRVYVPLEAWEYHSPLLKLHGRTSDVGLLAEALVFYDQVVAGVQTSDQITDLVRWAIADGHINDLLELIWQGVLSFHHHAFLTVAMKTEEGYNLVHIQEEPEAKTFYSSRLIANSDLSMLHARKSSAVRKAVESHIRIDRPEGYTPPIEDAIRNLQDADHNAQLLQAFIDELFRHHLGQQPPKVECGIVRESEGKWNVTTNLDFAALKRLTGDRLDFRLETHFLGEVHANRTLWTASQLELDLYIGSVMSDISKRKLEEAEDRAGRGQENVGELEVQVGFPDIRSAVNNGYMSLQDILRFRKRAEPFRQWLRSLSESDRDTALAYYNEEVARSIVPKGTSTVLRIVGAVAGTGAIVSQAVDPSGLASVGLKVVGPATGFLSIIAGRYAGSWKPVMFGKWLSDQSSPSE
jgi:hypothetical protein